MYEKNLGKQLADKLKFEIEYEESIKNFRMESWLTENKVKYDNGLSI